jgi:hypothetical protein
MLIFDVHDQYWHMVCYRVMALVLGDMKAHDEGEQSHTTFA